MDRYTHAVRQRQEEVLAGSALPRCRGIGRRCAPIDSGLGGTRSDQRLRRSTRWGFATRKPDRHRSLPLRSRTTRKTGSHICRTGSHGLLLLDIAEHRKLPVLGICYGAQSLNVFRGGSLVQDIPSQIPDAVAHDRDGQPEEVRSHLVRVEKDSQLERVLDHSQVDVNSYHHHQSGDPGRHLRVTRKGS